MHRNLKLLIAILATTTFNLQAQIDNSVLDRQEFKSTGIHSGKLYNLCITKKLPLKKRKYFLEQVDSNLFSTSSTRLEQSIKHPLEASLSVNEQGLILNTFELRKKQIYLKKRYYDLNGNHQGKPELFPIATNSGSQKSNNYSFATSNDNLTIAGIALLRRKDSYNITLASYKNDNSSTKTISSFDIPLKLKTLRISDFLVDNNREMYLLLSQEEDATEIYFYHFDKTGTLIKKEKLRHKKSLIRDPKFHLHDKTIKVGAWFYLAEKSIEERRGFCLFNYSVSNNIFSPPSDIPVPDSLLTKYSKKTLSKPDKFEGKIDINIISDEFGGGFIIGERKFITQETETVAHRTNNSAAVGNGSKTYSSNTYPITHWEELLISKFSDKNKFEPMHMIIKKQESYNSDYLFSYFAFVEDGVLNVLYNEEPHEQVDTSIKGHKRLYTGGSSFSKIMYCEIDIDNKLYKSIFDWKEETNYTLIPEWCFKQNKTLFLCSGDLSSRLYFDFK